MWRSNETLHNLAHNYAPTIIKPEELEAVRRCFNFDEIATLLEEAEMK